jgi:hypothetical protein
LPAIQLAVFSFHGGTGNEDELGIVNAFTADQRFHRAGRGVRPLVEQKAGRLRRVRLA